MQDVDVSPSLSLPLPLFQSPMQLPLRMTTRPLVFGILSKTAHEDESIMDGYLQLACSPAVLYGGRNMELAYHFLYRLGGSIKVTGSGHMTYHVTY